MDPRNNQHPDLDSLLDQWEDQRSSGSSLSADAFVAQYCQALSAELVQQLKDRIVKLQSINARLSTTDFSSDDSRHSDSKESLPLALSNGMTLSTAIAYEVDRFLARGGLGEVHVAHDLRLGREVAIKLLQERRCDSEREQKRFLREAEITSRLEHPGVVPVYGIGRTAENRAFYAMRLVDGESLRDAIRRHHQVPETTTDHRLEFQQLLGRFVSVCNAVAYAHNRGVVHRDIKPTNIILGKFGETLVVDWGLAKDGMREDSSACQSANDDSDELATRNGTVMGTLAYMSPEQASGEPAKVGPASDVFSLGATLVEILTGSPPLSPVNGHRSLSDAQIGRFASPLVVRPATPEALDAICRKAMSVNPSDRYATPLELAKDVERWLADEPVSVWKDEWQVRLRRWAIRHRTLLTGAICSILVALIALAISTIYLTQAWREERLAKDRAEVKEREAERSRNEALENLRLARQTVDRLRQDARLFPLPQPGQSAPFSQQLPPPREHEKWPVQWENGAARSEGGQRIDFQFKLLRCRWHATGPDETVHVFVFRMIGDPQDLFVVTTALALPAERVLEIYLSRRTSSSVPTKP